MSSIICVCYFIPYSFFSLGVVQESNLRYHCHTVLFINKIVLLIFYLLCMVCIHIHGSEHSLNRLFPDIVLLCYSLIVGLLL